MAPGQTRPNPYRPATVGFPAYHMGGFGRGTGRIVS